MLRKRNNFILDHRTVNDVYGRECKLPISNGLVIKKKDETDYTAIAYILWSAVDDSCYIQTIADRFQTYVVVYDDFADFIYMVDEAEDLLNTVYRLDEVRRNG